MNEQYDEEVKAAIEEAEALVTTMTGLDTQVEVTVDKDIAGMLRDRLDWALHKWRNFNRKPYLARYGREYPQPYLDQAERLMQVFATAYTSGAEQPAVQMDNTPDDVELLAHALIFGNDAYLVGPEDAWVGECRRVREDAKGFVRFLDQVDKVRGRYKLQTRLDFEGTAKNWGFCD